MIEALTELKQGKGPPFVIFGGRQLIQALLPHDLIDEITLLVIPVVLGSGKRLFDVGDPLGAGPCEDATLVQRRGCKAPIGGQAICIPPPPIKSRAKRSWRAGNGWRPRIRPADLPRRREAASLLSPHLA